jgi:hypothetical protein
MYYFFTFHNITAAKEIFFLYLLPYIISRPRIKCRYVVPSSRFSAFVTLKLIVIVIRRSQKYDAFYGIKFVPNFMEIGQGKLAKNSLEITYTQSPPLFPHHVWTLSTTMKRRPQALITRTKLVAASDGDDRSHEHRTDACGSRTAMLRRLNSTFRKKCGFPLCMVFSGPGQPTEHTRLSHKAAKMEGGGVWMSGNL